MDYVVGGIAALLTGNVTPNRPKVSKRALTPMKHQPSPNVTPKSESLADRSIFLSPTMQKKKAIVKKSPKRIFQNSDLDSTSEKDGNSSLLSPIAEKVKKHLKDELDANISTIKSSLSPKNKVKKSIEPQSLIKRNISKEVTEEIQVSNESTPKKKKIKRSIVSETYLNDKSNKSSSDHNQDLSNTNMDIGTVNKKKKKSNQFTVETIDNNGAENINLEKEDVDKIFTNSKKKKNKSKVISNTNLDKEKKSSENKENKSKIKSKGKKNKKSKETATNNLLTIVDKQSESGDNVGTEHSEITDTTYINPNAITNEDTDSEHESDDDIESENEENNKAVLDTGPEGSSDDEEDEVKDEKSKKKQKIDKDEVKKSVPLDEEVKRTLFVGNVPFNSKCKKEVKRIFDKYGEIETVRIRTVPVKDASVTPKLAVIKNELHPDRSTVNVYIKYAHSSAVYDALVENNTVLNGNHLRVARSDVTGSEHDPKLSVFVGNIPFALEDEGLRAKFEDCGEIESVRIVRDRKTNAGKGFGYVNFASKDGVELALALTEEDLTIKNRILRVKRCTQITANKQGKQQDNQGRQWSNQSRHQNLQGRQQNYQGRQQNFQGRQQTFQGRQQNYQGRQQIQSQGRQFNNRGSQVNRPGNNQFGNSRFQGRNQNTDGKTEGAYRRIMNKRKPEESKEGPPEKRARNINEANKEKKPRKEFVGVTAGKKKFQKHKLNKDQKKKKVLSEILTKQRQR